MLHTLVSTKGIFAKVMFVLRECAGIKAGHLLTGSPGATTEHFPNKARCSPLGWDSVSHCPGDSEQSLKWKEQDQKERVCT